MTIIVELLSEKLKKPAEQLSSNELFKDREDPLHDAIQFLVTTDVVHCALTLITKNYPHEKPAGLLGVSNLLLRTMKELDPSITKREHDLIKDELPLLLQASERLLGEGFFDQLNGELNTLWERNPVSKVWA